MMILNSSYKSIYLVCIIIFLSVDIHLDLATAHAQDVSGITSPATGSSVSGDVPILGTAVIEPFQRYELFIKQEPNGDDAYIYFTGGNEQVRNGQLGILRTGDFPPGVYSIRLRVVKADGNYAEYFAQNVSMNQGPTPTPTSSEPTPTPIPTSTFTPAPQPTAAVGQVGQPQVDNIQVAPTDTPEPIAAAAESDVSENVQEIEAPAISIEEVIPNEADVETNSISRQLGEALSLQRLRTQFFNGVRVSAALFLGIFIVFAAKWILGWMRSQI